MIIQVQKENEQDQAHIFQDTYSRHTFQDTKIHQLAKMYRFEHTNYDIHFNFSFQNL